MSSPTITAGRTPGNPMTSSSKGRLNLIYFVSKTHGAAVLAGSSPSNHQLVPMPVLQTFNITPKQTSETVPQFGKLNANITVPDYADCEVAFDIIESDLFQVYAAIMDLPPNSTAFTYMPEMLLHNEFTAFGNQFHEETGGIFESFIVTGISLTSSSRTQDPSKSAKISFKGTGTIYRQAMGVAIDYARFTNSSPAYTTPYDVVLSSGYAGTLNNLAATNLLPPNLPNFVANTYTNYQLVLKNGEPITTGFSISAASPSVFDLLDSTDSPSINASGLATDIYEVFYPVSGVPVGNIN